MVDRSLFAIIDVLQGTKTIFLYLICVWEDDFHKKFQILEKKFSFYFISHNVFMLLLLLRKPSKQSEHLGLHPDTSSLVLDLLATLINLLIGEIQIEANCLSLSNFELNETKPSRNQMKACACCSDFRYKSNGIFVLVVSFFLFRQISTF